MCFGSDARIAGQRACRNHRQIQIIKQHRYSRTTDAAEIALTVRGGYVLADEARASLPGELQLRHGNESGKAATMMFSAHGAMAMHHVTGIWGNTVGNGAAQTAAIDVLRLAGEGGHGAHLIAVGALTIANRW